MATAVVLIIVFAAVFLAIRHMRKKGPSCCGDCASCSLCKSGKGKENNSL